MTRDQGGGSAGGWEPPRSGAYGGGSDPTRPGAAAYGGASAPTQIQGGGWAPPPAAASPAPPLAPPSTPQNPGWPPSPPPGPAFAPSGPGYGGPPGGYGGPSAPPPIVGSTVTRHRPGVGLLLGLAGAAALVLSLTALPWVSSGGQDASFSDIREAYENVDDLTNTPSLGGGSPAPTTTTTPDGGGSLGQPVAPPIPSADEVTDTAETTGKNAYLEFYTKWGWIGVLVAVSVAILFTTLVVPSNKAGRMLTGFCMAGMIGVGLNAADDEGSVAPKLCGALTTLVAAGLHGAAIWSLFSEDLAPDPATGVWAGVAGLAVVFVGCLVGTRRERVNAAYA